MREEGSVGLPHAFGRVWDAARTVFERAEWGTKKADREAEDIFMRS
jgi:hypothetical protein